MTGVKRIIAAVCMAFFVAVQTAFPVFAESGTNELLEYLGTESDDFYNELSFGENDWAAYCDIRLNGADGAENYLKNVKLAAAELISSDGFVKPTELQRAAVILSSVGICSEELILAAVYNNERLDRQGFNAYIWALIAANCCQISEPEGAVNTKASLAQHIISKQLSDGGFCLKGTAADTDITAAAIYALAPLRSDKEISSALDKAEECLSSLQLESGGFMSMGIENCESTAQAIIALCALGYNADDARVSAALEALEQYRTDSGYSHISGGSASGIASVQCLQAFTALELSERGEGLLFPNAKKDSEDIEPTIEAAEQDSVQTSAPSSEPTESENQEVATGDNIRVVIAAILALGGAAFVLAWLIRGRKKPLLLAVGVVMLLAFAVVFFSDIKTPEEYYASASDNSGEGITVSVSASCFNAIEASEKAVRDIELPSDGYIITLQSVSVADGSTAFDALISAARLQEITVDHTNSLMGVYVSGIGGLYEFDYGSESGWLYYVNGDSPSAAMSQYTLSEGDTVELVYTCELGR